MTSSNLLNDQLVTMWSMGGASNQATEPLKISGIFSLFNKSSQKRYNWAKIDQISGVHFKAKIHQFFEVFLRPFLHGWKWQVAIKSMINWWHCASTLATTWEVCNVKSYRIFISSAFEFGSWQHLHHIYDTICLQKSCVCGWLDIFDHTWFHGKRGKEHQLRLMRLDSYHIFYWLW